MGKYFRREPKLWEIVIIRQTLMERAQHLRTLEDLQKGFLKDWVSSVYHKMIEQGLLWRVTLKGGKRRYILSERGLRAYHNYLQRHLPFPMRKFNFEAKKKAWQDEIDQSGGMIYDTP